MRAAQCLQTLPILTHHKSSVPVELKQILKEQADNVTESGGTMISMDARVPNSPYRPGYNQTEQWILAAMSGFFAFVACIGCLVVCAQAGILRRTDLGIGTVGERLLTEDQVLKLPTIDYGSRDETRTCAICIEEFSDGDKLRQLPCEHEFHTECILPWLTERHSSCPLCKHDVRPIEEEVSEASSRTGDSHVTNPLEWYRAAANSFLTPRRRGRILVANEEDGPHMVIQESQEAEELDHVASDAFAADGNEST